MRSSGELGNNFSRVPGAGPTGATHVQEGVRSIGDGVAIGNQANLVMPLDSAEQRERSSTG